MFHGGIRVADGNLGSALILMTLIGISESRNSYKIILYHQELRFSHFGPMTRSRMRTPRSSRPAYTMTYRMILILTVTLTRCPYGDNLDVIWLGHRGMKFPHSPSQPLPGGRVVHTNDETVPEDDTAQT